MKAKFWRTLIWEPFVSSENFSFKGLSLGLFKWSKKTSPPVVSSCYWLAQPLSFWGVSPKAQLGWQCEGVTAHGFPITEQWQDTPQVAVREPPVCKNVTGEIRIMLAQQLRIGFVLYFIQLYIFVLIEKSDFSGHCWWCRGCSRGLVSEKSRFLGCTAKAKLHPRDLLGLLDFWHLIHNFSWGVHSTKYIVSPSPYLHLLFFTGCIWYEAAQKKQGGVSVVSTVVQKHHRKKKKKKVEL